MQRMGYSNDGRLHTACGQQCVLIGIAGHTGPGFGGIGQPGRVGVANCGQCQAGHTVIPQALGVCRAHVANADDRRFYLFHFILPRRRSWTQCP